MLSIGLSGVLIDTLVLAITSAELLLAVCLFFGAALCTSTGHAGASSYIDVMALFGIPATVMRPTALVLNILVATFTSFRFVRAGLFRWRTLWPVLLGVANSFCRRLYPVSWPGLQALGRCRPPGCGGKAALAG